MVVRLADRWVPIADQVDGEQQPEVEHDFIGTDSAIHAGGGRVTQTSLAVTIRDEDGTARVACVTVRGVGTASALRVVADGDLIGE